MKVFTLVSAFCITSTILVLTASGQDHYYWPTAVGNDHYYQISGDTEQMIRRFVPGEAHGASTLMVELIESGEVVDSGGHLHTTDSEGRVWYHGWLNSGTGAWVLFDQPLLYIDAPLAIGSTWDTWTDSPFGFYQVRGECVAVELVSVPAGTFECYHVHYSESYFDITEEYDHWYCDGVGLIQFDDHQLLPGYVTPVESSTWSSVKELFR